MKISPLKCNLNAPLLVFILSPLCLHLDGIFYSVKAETGVGSNNDESNKLVAHYRRIIPRTIVRRDADQYWSSDTRTGQRRFHPAAPGFLDIYIYAPGKFTTKQVGQSIHFDCELTDGYTGNWHRENNMPFPPHAELKKLENRNIYRIDLEQLTEQDSGKYICSANTGVQTDQESVHLQVVAGSRDPHMPQWEQPELSQPTDVDSERYLYEEEAARRRQQQFWQNEQSRREEEPIQEGNGEAFDHSIQSRWPMPEYSDHRYDPYHHEENQRGYPFGQDDQGNYNMQEQDAAQLPDNHDNNAVGFSDYDEQNDEQQQQSHQPQHPYVQQTDSSHVNADSELDREDEDGIFAGVTHAELHVGGLPQHTAKGKVDDQEDEQHEAQEVNEDDPSNNDAAYTDYIYDYMVDE